MHRVIEYIDRHLAAKLELRALARVANFSSFHFHRVFFAWTGEKLGTYVRRRRLEIAAIRLAGEPRSTVLEIALAVGFGSAEAFTRAFKRRFGRAPTPWRAAQAQKRNLKQVHRNPGQVGQSTRRHSPRSSLRLLGAAMKVEVIERQPVKIAYLRHTGPYGKSLGAFWQSTVYPWIAANRQLGQPRYGISLDDPTITAPSKCRYDAGIEVSGSLAMPGASQTTTVPGGTYAMTAFRGTSDQIGEVWETMLREWLPQSGMRLDTRPFFEYYGANSSFDATTGIFTCDIAIPVARL